jgi:hypothetical protein
MPWRTYTFEQKYPKRDGTVSIYKLKNKKWIKSIKPYKPQKRGLEKQAIWSSRFGLLELYNRKEQQQLICQSGYSISQCFNILRKMWYGYHRARLNDKSIAKMEKYAKAVQAVQKDMGIKTTSFPHLRIYGDQLILNNSKGERIVVEDHSAMQKQQEEYDKWMAEIAKKIQEKVQKPDKEKGEKIVTFPDISFSNKDVDSEGYLIPNVLVPDEEYGEKLITMTDDTPFYKEKSEEIISLVDRSYRKKYRADKEYLVPNVLVPDEEEGEERVTMTDDTPFQN